MRHICMPQDLTADEIARFEEIICATQTIQRKTMLYRTGDSFKYLYAIRSGSIKTVLTLKDGREQITGIHLAGEALGFEGIGNDFYSCSAIALEDSSLCFIPYHLLIRICREIGTLQHQLYKHMSDQIIHRTSQMMLLGTFNAEERVAAFLLDISLRHKQRGYSPHEFMLHMTREEMGSYLGITLETMSRILSRFQQRGLIKMKNKQIHITHFDELLNI